MATGLAPSPREIHPNVLPVDAAAIRKYGLARWSRDYRCPIAAADFARFVQFLFDGLAEIFMSVGHSEQETLLAASDFIVTLRDVLHADALRSWALENAHTLDMGQAASGLFRPDFASLSNPYARAGATFKLAARAAARSWAENRSLGTAAQLKAFIGADGMDWSLGTMGGLKSSEIERLGDPVRTIYADSLIGKALAAARPVRQPQLERGLDSFAASLDRMLKSALAQGMVAPTFSVAALMAAWKARCATTRGLIDALRTVIRRPPRRLHLNEVWKANHRAIAFAARGMGSDVISYAHGNDPMFVLQPQYTFMAYPHNTTYICETPASAASHAAHYANAPSARSFPVHFRSADVSTYVQGFAATSPEPLPGARARVMVMGYPMLPHRTQFDVTNGLAMHLEAERRILALLREHGLRAQYKAHPETRTDAQGLFDDVADEIIFEPFESVLEQTDVVLFLTTVSSTFGAALCTRKPIVVLDHAGKNWNPMLKDLVARRCRLVPSWIGADNRITFQASALLSALELPGATPDFTVVDDVFSPKPWTGPTSIEQQLSRSILASDSRRLP